MSAENPEDDACLYMSGGDASAPSHCDDDATVSVLDAADDGDFSDVGLLCQDILSTVGGLEGMTDPDRNTFGRRVNAILELFREYADRQRNAKKQISALKSRVKHLGEELAVLRKAQFGQSSEKDHTGDLDDDLGLAVDDEEDEPRAPMKGKRARKIGQEVPVIFEHHYPDGRSCSSCGCEMNSMKSEERGGTFRMVPEHVVLVKNVYHTCACNRSELCKENKPVSAKAKSYIMKNRGLDLGFVVEAATQKFFEHMPSYRMESRLLNSNVNLSRQTIGRNIAHVADYLEPVRQALLDHIKASHAAHMDETRLRVQAPGKGKCHQGYLWAICRDERGWNEAAQPAVFYEYAHSRAGTVAEELLSGSALRYLQTDSYAGYNRLFPDEPSNDGMRSVKCWAHVRRKFREALLTQKSPLAESICKLIAKLYIVESQAKGLTAEERAAMRHEHSLPNLKRIHDALLKYKDDAHGKVKAAIAYTLNAFDGLQHYIFDGRLEIDNNPVERCIRGVALTRKNSLFAGSHDAAKVWAIYYTLIESARLNRINPRSYLNWVANEIERARGDLDYTLLMPWHCPVGHLDN